MAVSPPTLPAPVRPFSLTLNEDGRFSAFIIHTSSLGERPFPYQKRDAQVKHGEDTPTQARGNLAGAGLFNDF
ncbi:MAG: hypothetical protein H6667_19175 [Ardenticatenaceae bacterium]|nr:hypothetical protein [Ardenticatenaceae bacterium]MCB9446159.1 hypothetical protein [Ardenticatenaceae bacterium]